MLTAPFNPHSVSRAQPPPQVDPKETEMKSTLIVATVLAAALTSASTIPALAAKNTGAFQQSVEAANQSLCDDYRAIFQSEVEHMNKAPKGSKAYKEARKQANETLGLAWKAGCAWAQ
jgi:type IV secretory pathway VirB10-like protein